MDSDRKYKQRGYVDTQRPDVKSERNGDERPRQPGPRPPIDVTGPRLPRLVQAVTASRCFNCTTQLPPGNDCTLFEPRVTVARDAAPAPPPAPTSNGQVPRNQSDARNAFDALFKKPST